MEQKREFYVDTPIGKLRLYAKSEEDSAEDYPGVYVDLIPNGRGSDDGKMLACVEYESVEKVVQTCIYQPEVEEPVQIVKHNPLGGTFLCTVTEMLTRTVVIKADCRENAEDALAELYKNEEIFLTLTTMRKPSFTPRKRLKAQTCRFISGTLGRSAIGTKAVRSKGGSERETPLPDKDLQGRAAQGLRCVPALKG